MYITTVQQHWHDAMSELSRLHISTVTVIVYAFSWCCSMVILQLPGLVGPVDIGYSSTLATAAPTTLVSTHLSVYM
jgi:hypothetical protein